MDKIQEREGIAKLPVTAWEDALQEFLAPVAAQAPDVRVRRLFILVLSCLARRSSSTTAASPGPATPSAGCAAWAANAACGSTATVPTSS